MPLVESGRKKKPSHPLPRWLGELSGGQVGFAPGGALELRAAISRNALARQKLVRGGHGGPTQWSALPHGAVKSSPW
jgi:hypothetical protein